MATAYTSLLGLALPVTGELQGTWGTTVNDSITSLLDTAVAGTTTLSADADVTLTTTTGASNQARQAIILWTANGSVTRNITAPAQSKIYTVINASAGTQSIVIRGAGPTAGVTIVKGESALVAWNGSDFIKISNTGGAGSFTNVTVSGTTTLSGLTASTALALNASKEVVSVTNTGTGNNVLSASPTLTGTVAGASLQLSSLTSGRVTYAGTSGLLQDSANLTFDGTSLTLGGNPTLSGGTANGVLYLNGSKVATSGSALTFDGTNLALGMSALAARVMTVRGRAAFVAPSNDSQLAIYSDGTTNGIYSTYNSGGSYLPMTFYTSDVERYRIGTDGTAIWTIGSEQMRLTSTGLGIGTSSPSTYSLAPNLVVATASSGGLTIRTGSSNYGGVFFADGTTGDEQYRGYIQYNHNFAGVTDYMFFGTAGATRMTLTDSGNLGLGVTPSVYTANSRVFQVDGGANAAEIKLTNNTSGASGATGAIFQMTGNDLYIWNSENSFLSLGTNNTERARITSGGDLLVGTTTQLQAADSRLNVAGDFYNANGVSLKTTNGGSGSQFVGFINESGTLIGSINRNTTTNAVLYNTTSDQRLKSNVEDADSVLSKIMQVQVRQYDWTEGNVHQDCGFIAQEIEPILSGVVTKGKSEDDLWQLDYSKLTPYLVKAIQEQQALITDLRARVQALEAQP